MTSEKITPQDAADILPIPASFLSALVDCGALKPDAGGSFERAAVLAHKAFRDALRAEALACMKARAWEEPDDYRFDRDEANE